MGDILEFPSQQAQGLAYLERQLREMLAARGADQGYAVRRRQRSGAGGG